MQNTLSIAGGGIGGLASALALSQSGWKIELLEQSAEFGEFGAGIQLGPNAVRILQSWGLTADLLAVAARPRAMEVRQARNASVLARLPLADAMERRFGAPYVTIARADLHAILLRAVQAQAGVALQAGVRLDRFTESDGAVRVDSMSGSHWHAAGLIGADGIWSAVRAQMLGDGAPRASGHLAYRAMVPQSALPAALRLQNVQVWMGPEFHLVQYPVRGGEWLNVVAVVHGHVNADLRSWDHSANAADLRRHLAKAAAPLQDLLRTIEHWRLWPLLDRPPLQSARQHARGRVALLGDAAHPMRPYLAQGAGMAIEDAFILAQCLADSRSDVPAAFEQFAGLRWQRNARVQSRAVRNGQIFHLSGPAAIARDIGLQTLGARLLDLSWLYSGP